ncbi:MAG: bifunctional nuclease family protein [Deltaproteobacteria bacterium]|nr:bifunctional nuclease family protein [Deltaproteobacteria bacterium]
MKTTAALAAIFLLGPLSPALAGKTPSASPAAPEAPKGFVEMKVQGVVPTRQGNAVVLTLEQEKLLLPIWIGDAEAFAIQLRLDRRRFQRPLTHDLLDAITRELGGRLIKVHVDDLKGNTFVGTVFIKQGERTLEVDARPSDSIALAVGNRIPIFVSRKVLERAGVKQEADSGQPKPEKDPEKLLKDILKDEPGEEHTL